MLLYPYTESSVSERLISTLLPSTLVPPQAEIVFALEQARLGFPPKVFLRASHSISLQARPWLLLHSSPPADSVHRYCLERQNWSDFPSHLHSP